MTIELLDNFMLESNRIEGESFLNPKDSEVIQDIYKNGINNLDDILLIHKKITDHLEVNWSGKWRHVNVRVGSYLAPDYSIVPRLMAEYWNHFESMDSWTAHNEFEKVHPFIDFNGRIGRIIWLFKALKEGFNLSMPFLQKYYYQTLEHIESK